MVKNNILNLIYLFVSLIILSVFWFNTYYIFSSIIGSIILLLYIIFFGSWTGSLIFPNDPKLNQMLFGTIIVICWTIVSQGTLVIFKRFTSESLLLPLFILPLVLLGFGLIFERRRNGKRAKECPSLIKEHYGPRDSIPIFLFLIGFLGSLFSAFHARNDVMLFSIWEVVPFYFWIFMFITLISFVFLQKRIKNKFYGFEVSMICSFLIAFLFFGIMVLVVEFSFDPDIWDGLSIVRVIFNLGGRDPTGGLIIINSGYHGFLATYAKSMGTTFDLESLRWFTWLWSPIMASIYIPFITYQFLRLFYSEEKMSHAFYLGIISFMIFPSFWLMSVSVAEMVGDILMYINLFFIALFISDGKPYRGLTLMVLTTIATYLVHPISGTFALMADLVAISFHRKIWKIKKLRYIFLAVTTLLALSLFPSEFTWAQTLLYKGVPRQLSSICLKETINFWFSPIWLPSLYTADSIMSENYNWFRYALLITGILALKSIKAYNEGRMKAWFVFTIIIFWVGWFITVNGIDLTYSTHRFARNVDLALLPLASLIFYEISKINHLSFLLDGKIKMNKIITINLKLKKHKLSLVFSQPKLSATLMISLIILGMLSSFYVAYSIPSFSKNGLSAEPGRPTWRTVTGEEVSIVEYINASSKGQNYSVLSYGFIPKLVSGILGYRYNGKECNLAIAPGLVSYNTLKLMFDPSPSYILQTMAVTNSSVVFFVIEDWYVKHYNIQLGNLNKLKSFASEYRVFGTDYKFYVFKFDSSSIKNLYRYINPVNEYNVRSTIILADDEKTSFWSTFAELSGYIGAPTVSLENNTKISGDYSTKILISEGIYGRVGIYKNFDLPQNWSTKKYISLFMFGNNSFATITIYLMAPTADASLSFSFVDCWEGWGWIKIPLEEFAIVRGTPDWSKISHISIQFTNVQPGNYVLIDKIEVGD